MPLPFFSEFCFLYQQSVAQRSDLTFLNKTLSSNTRRLIHALYMAAFMQNSDPDNSYIHYPRYQRVTADPLRCQQGFGLEIFIPFLEIQILLI